MTGEIGMEKNKGEILKECFNMLDAEFGDKLTEQSRIYKKELFKKIIGNYPGHKIKQMTLEIIKTRKYNSFPKIAEMIEKIEGNTEEESERAWIYLLEKVQSEGYYHSVTFPLYPAVAGAVQAMGGWIRFNEELTHAEEKWKKKEFVKIYPIYKKTKNYPEYLIGFFELDNNGKGYDQESMSTRGMTIDGRRKIRKTKQIDKKRDDAYGKG